MSKLLIFFILIGLSKSNVARVAYHPAHKKTVSGKKAVSINSIELGGNYAIKLIFDDGHATGIYTWQYLQELFNGKDKIWKGYISELRKKGLNRD